MCCPTAALASSSSRIERSGRASAIVDASGFVATLPISLHADPADRHRAWDLARRYDNYPIYDMLYVALAERLGEPLVTVDDTLRRRLAHLSLVLRPDEALKIGPAPSAEKGGGSVGVWRLSQRRGVWLGWRSFQDRPVVVGGGEQRVVGVTGPGSRLGQVVGDRWRLGAVGPAQRADPRQPHSLYWVHWAAMSGSCLVHTLRFMDGRQRDRGRGGGVSGWVGDPAAVYCRISKARDEDQTGVDRQERLCREVAQRLGLVIVPGCVFVDNNRSAWQRSRNRPGWNALLEAIRVGRLRHVIVYHPDRLMRQPRDLEELLTLSDEHDITLHGQANRRELSDPDDRFFLRIEVAHACRSSDDTSRRLRDALEDRAREGRAHVSARRAYGYAPGGEVVVESEAEVVREIFARYLDGTTPRQIAAGLNERGVPTAQGCRWQPESVRAVVASRHVTGIRVFRGRDFGDGDWPVIIDRGTWSEAQDRRAYRASAYGQRPFRFYVLRGVVMCKRCAKPMAGAVNNHTPYYACTRRADRDGARCIRRINAPKLEAFVTDAAVELLTRLTVTGTPTATLALPEADEAAISTDEAELAELKDMWTHRELSTREYRQMRKTVEDRIDALRRKTIVRPTAEVLSGLVGPGARAAWDHLAERGDGQRMNAVLRFLFAAVIIDAHHGRRGTFDYSRIDIEPNPL